MICTVSPSMLETPHIPLTLLPYWDLCVSHDFNRTLEVLLNVGANFPFQVGILSSLPLKACMNVRW